MTQVISIRSVDKYFAIAASKNQTKVEVGCVKQMNQKLLLRLLLPATTDAIIYRSFAFTHSVAPNGTLILGVYFLWQLRNAS